MKIGSTASFTVFKISLIPVKALDKGTVAGIAQQHELELQSDDLLFFVMNSPLLFIRIIFIFSP